jgi:CBS domain-containing protein
MPHDGRRVPPREQPDAKEDPMAQTLKDVMTSNVVSLPGSSVTDGARAMRDSGIGDVIVTQNNKVAGIVTDRDITVRAVAEGKDPDQVPLSDICSGNVTSLSSSDDVSKAVQLMRQKALRRLPIVDNGKAVGIVSIGDLAMEQDSGSALADISAAKPNT